MKPILFLALALAVSSCSGKDAYVPALEDERLKAASLIVGQSTIADTYAVLGLPDDFGNVGVQGASSDPLDEYVIYHFRGGDLRVNFKWTCLDPSGCNTGGLYDGTKKSNRFYSGYQVGEPMNTGSVWDIP